MQNTNTTAFPVKTTSVSNPGTMPANQTWSSSQASSQGGWASLGGNITGKIAVGQHADGRLEVFVRAADRTLRNRWQTAPNGSWSNWTSLGGNIDNPVVAQNADGRLEIFARGIDNALWHCWQTAPNGRWSTWTSLGGHMLHGDFLTVGQNADGRLEAFIQGTVAELWHCYQTVPNGNWSGWTSLGGHMMNAPTVAQNADGRLEVFVLGGSSDVQHCWQTAANNGWGNWSSLGWTGVGRHVQNLVAAGQNADGRLEIFARSSDGALWHRWQTIPNGGWSNWSSLDSPLGLGIGSITVAQNADGRLEVFISGSSNTSGSGNTIWHRWQTTPNGGWSDWTSLGQNFSSPVAVAQNADGRLEIWAKGTDNALWHRWQVTPGNWN